MQRETKQEDGQPTKDDRLDEARRNGNWNGRGGKDGKTARNETGNGKELAKTWVGNAQRNRRDGHAERVKHEEMWNETDETEMSHDGLTTFR